MKKFLARANKSISIGWAASLLSGSFLLSALLGLLRERLLIANFGIGETLDAYIVAFSIPDFMYYILVSGALSVTFIPVFTQRLQTGNKESAWQLSSSLINLLAITTMTASVLIFIFAPWLTPIIAKGSSPEVQQTAASLMRIIAVNPFLFGISSVLASMQQAVGRFVFNALAPVIYNIGIIVGIVVFAPALGTPNDPNILGVALGVGLGAITQLLVQLLGMAGIGFKYQRHIFWKNLGFRRVLRLLPARSFDQSIDYFNAMVERFVASFLFAGAITSYQAALTLRTVPITLIGVAISTAAFPKISERAGSNRTDLFKKEFISLLRVIFWLALPASLIAFFMRGYLVRLLAGDGNPVIAAVLAWFTLSIVMRAMFHAVTRSFYAQQDTMTPLKISVFSILLNIVLAFILTDKMGIVGLAAAQSITALFEVTVLLFELKDKIGSFFTRSTWIAGLKMLIAGLGMSIVNYLFVSRVFPLRAEDVGFFTLAPKFVLIVLVSGIVYIGLSFALKIHEAGPVINSVGKFFYKPLKVERK